VNDCLLERDFSLKKNSAVGYGLESGRGCASTGGNAPRTRGEVERTVKFAGKSKLMRGNIQRKRTGKKGNRNGQLKKGRIVRA